MELNFVFISLYSVFCLCLGSAISAYVHRTPQYEMYLWRKEAHEFLNLSFNETAPSAFHSGRSQCPHCHTQLTMRDLIPLLSYLLNRGQCRHCQEKITVTYPLIEVGTLALCLPLLLVVPSFISLFILTGMICLLICISFIDWQHQWIPDQLNIGLLGLGLSLTLAANHSPLEANVLGMMFGYLFIIVIRQIYLKLKGIEAIGLGDAKLLAALGAWQGIDNLFYLVFYASLLGLIYALLTRKGRYQSLAFGPFLCMAALIHFYSSNFM